jgi:hypothetical protein
LNYNCFNLLDIRNLQEQVKKAFCYQKLFWPFTVWINCDKWSQTFCKFSAFFLTVSQNNFGNKIPIPWLVVDIIKSCFLHQKPGNRIQYSPLFLAGVVHTVRFLFFFPHYRLDGKKLYKWNYLVLQTLKLPSYIKVWNHQAI